MPVAKLVVSTVFDPRPWRLAVLALVALVLVAAGWTWRSDGRRRRTFPDIAVAWWTWHWFTGERLEVHRIYPDFDVERARYIARRALVGAGRTVLAGLVVLAEYLRSGAPAGTAPSVLAAVAVGGALVAGALVVGVFFVAWMVSHYLRWVRPLHYAVHKACGWPATKLAVTYLVVPRLLAHGARGVVVKLPRDFDVRTKNVEWVDEAVRKTLQLNEVTMTPVHRGHRNYMAWRPREPMPEKAPLSDLTLRAQLEGGKPAAPIIGVTRGGTVKAVDLDTDFPHVLWSAGTGGGKSAALRAICAQLMRHDNVRVLVIDIKRHSHRWLRLLPDVTYARDVEEIHDALVWLGEEGERRNRAWDDVDLGEQGPTFPRIVVLCEELNATMDQLGQWWKNNRPRGGDVISPAIVGLRSVLFMGRAVQIHVLAVAQMATARSLGGPEGRENFAVRVLANYSANAAKMLVPDCNLPAADSHKGRAMVCIGKDATPVQVIWMTEEEARAWVAETRGLIERPVAGVAGRDTRTPQGNQPATVAGEAAGGDEPVVGLYEASIDRGRGIVSLRHDALRQAAVRDPEFPPPLRWHGQTRLYSPAALQRWEKNRPHVRGTY